MLERIRICLLHPRFMGKFIIEKMWKIWVLLGIFIILNALAYLGVYYMSQDLSLYDRNSIINTIVNDKEVNLTFKDNILSGDSRSYAFLSGSNYIVYSFFNDPSKNEANNIYFMYNTNSVSIYVGTTFLTEANYNEFIIRDFTINKDTTNIDYMNLTSFISLPFTVISPVLLAVNTVVETFNLLFLSCIILLVTFLLAFNVNPSIRGKLRFILLLHALIPYLFFNLASILFNFSFLSYLGMFLSVLYFFIAIRSIVKVEGAK